MYFIPHSLSTVVWLESRKLSAHHGNEQIKQKLQYTGIILQF